MKLIALLTSAIIAGALLAPETASAHGCHRSAKDSKDGWHEHVGRNCRWVASSPDYRNPDSRCQTRCKYVGPFKKCKRVCDGPPRRWRRDRY